MLAYLGYRDLFAESDFEKQFFAEHRFSRLVANCALDMDNECNRVGMAYETGHGVTEDLEKAYVAYSKACALSNFYGCYNQGRFAYDGRGTEKDEALGLEKLSVACFQAKHGGACIKVGEIHSHSKNDDHFDLEKAYQAWAKACHLGIAQGCGMRDLFVLQRRHKIRSDGARELVKKAMDDFKRICDQPVPFGGDACIFYWEHLRKKGTKPKHHIQIAEAIHADQPTEGDKALRLAIFSRFELGPHKRDLELENESFETACETQALACYFRGLNAAEKEDVDAASTYFGKACDEDRYLGCSELRGLSLNPRAEEEAPPSPAENR